MANSDNEVKMMMSVVPGAMTGFAALNAGMSSILNVFNSFTRSFDAQFGLMDAAITTTAFVVTQLGVDAMHAFGEFEQGMKIVQMVSGQTAQDMDFLKQKANDFSVQYRMDIDQITEGLQTLGRAGLNSASEQTEVLQAGLNTAKLEGRDLNAILQELIQNTSLLGGDLKSSEFGESSQYVNDLLVATSMTAPITTHDVSETLKYSGGIAAAAGANIETEQGKAILEDYMGAIAAFAQKGVTGSIAGTALRAFLNKPATQDSSVTEALASIKLKPEYLWEDGEETMKPISEQIGLIQKQMDKLDVSKMDRLQIWSKIVGGKMGQQMMKLDSESIKEVTKDIQAADSASNLAAGSMKTFEANVKQVSEQGQVLERNIGENLVFFANPILQLINKITEFLGQDGMAWPLTAGVLTAVGILAKRIVQVFNVARAELGSLLSMGKEALAIHVGKHGYAKWEEEEAIRQQQAQQQTTGSSGNITATTLKNFDKQYSSISSANNALSVSAMKAAEVSDQNIAVAGRLSSLTKQISIAGTTVSEGTLWGMAIKQGALTDSELSKLQAGHAAGLSGRALADSLGKGYIETIVPRIEALSLALKELGITVSAEAENVAAANLAYQKTFADSTKASSSKDWQATMNEQAKQYLDDQREKAAVNAQAHATALGIEATAEEEVGLKTQEMAAKVIADFEEMRAAVSMSMSGLGPKVNSFFSTVDLGWNKLYENNNVVGPFTPINPQEAPLTMPGYFSVIGNNFDEAQQFLMDYYFPPGLDQLREELGIPKETPVNPFSKGGMFYDEERGVYVSNYGDLNKGMSEIPSTHVGPADSLIGPTTEGQYILDEKGRLIKVPYGSGETNVPLANMNPTTPTYYGGQLPNQKEIDESIARNEAQQRADLSHVQYLEEGVVLEQERLEIVRGELVAEREKVSQLGNPRIGQDDYINAQKEAGQEVSKGIKEMNNNAEKQAKASAEAAERAADIEAKQPYNDTINNVLRPQDEAGAVYESDGESGFVTASSATHPYDRNAINEQYRLDRKYAQEQMREREKGLRTNAQINADQEKMRIRQARQLEQSQSLTERIKSKLSGTPTSFHPHTGESIPLSQRADASYHPATQKGYDPYDYKPAPYFGTLFGGNPSEVVEEEGKKNGQKFGESFRQNLSERLNRDRTGSFLSFGSETIAGGGVRSATKGLSGLANKALNAADAFGGPLMIAIMAVTTAIQIWQKAFQDYCQELQDAKKQLQEAYSERSSAEDQLEQTFREQNPNADPEEIEMMILDTYGQLYDDRKNHPDKWMEKTSQYLKDSSKYKEYEYNQEEDDGSYKEKEKEEDTYEEALRKNTAALYSATAEIDIAMSKLTTKMNDIQWGIDGWTGEITDGLGYMQDHLDGEGTTYTEAGNFLLTASQQDENYPGSKEMAGLLIEDFHDAQGNWKKGLETLYGKDSEFLTDVMNLHARTFLRGNDNYGVQGMAHFANRLTPDGRGRIQASMMNDKKTWQSVAKEIFKYESKNKKRVGTQETSNKRMERLIQKLQIDTHLSRMQVIQAAYFQELQDMYQVMEQVFTPLLAEQAKTLAQNLLGTQSIDESSSGTRSSTYGTQSIASVISANVALIARSKAAEAVYNEALALGPDEEDPNKKHMYELAKNSSDANEFYKKAMDESYGQGFFKSVAQTANGVATMVPGGAILTTAFGKKVTDAGKSLDESLNTQIGKNDYTAKQIGTVYRAMAQMMINPNLSFEQARKLSEKVVNDDPRSMSKIMIDIGKMYSNPNILKQIEAAYGASDMGEADGSGGSSGSGSGSGDSDKSEGTKKERVDLVLCNKKEIPKLNVNLFKKPPTFTVLNKNFKLRDVKINTEDKPKAIMASIKNAFIDVQKRSDPKIIQDEEAEYDPVAATDGNSLPSGSSKPRTNN